MHLQHQKVQGRPFQHYLFATGLASRVSDDEMLTLISQIKLGSLEARDAVITSSTPLLLSIVSRYVAKLGSPRLADELVSAAIFAALEVLEKIRIGKKILHDDNIIAVIVSAAHSAISKAIEHEPLITVPGSTRRTRKAEGQAAIVAPSCHALHDAFQNQITSGDDSGDEIVHTQGWWRGQRTKHRKNDESLTDFEIRDVLNQVIETPLERRIVELRVQEDTDKPRSDRAIANILGISVSNVHNTRKRLGMKLRKKLQ